MWVTQSEQMEMTMIAKCPHCDSLVSQLMANPVPAVAPDGKKWDAATYACPSCNKVLGAGLDMVFHSNSIIQAVEKAIARKS